MVMASDKLSSISKPMLVMTTYVKQIDGTMKEVGCRRTSRRRRCARVLARG